MRIAPEFGSAAWCHDITRFIHRLGRVVVIAAEPPTEHDLNVAEEVRAEMDREASAHFDAWRKPCNY